MLDTSSPTSRRRSGGASVGWTSTGGRCSSRGVGLRHGRGGPSDRVHRTERHADRRGPDDHSARRILKATRPQPPQSELHGIRQPNRPEGLRPRMTEGRSRSGRRAVEAIPPRQSPWSWKPETVGGPPGRPKGHAGPGSASLRGGSGRAVEARGRISGRGPHLCRRFPHRWAGRPIERRLHGNSLRRLPSRATAARGLGLDHPVPRRVKALGPRPCPPAPTEPAPGGASRP